jgi:hypothetical protein
MVEYLNPPPPTCPSAVSKIQSTQKEGGNLTPNTKVAEAGSRAAEKVSHDLGGYPRFPFLGVDMGKLFVELLNSRTRRSRMSANHRIGRHLGVWSEELARSKIAFENWDETDTR